jgi:hypothetical protein
LSPGTRQWPLSGPAVPDDKAVTEAAAEVMSNRVFTKSADTGNRNAGFKSVWAIFSF